MPGLPSIAGSTFERADQVVAVVEASTADQLAAGMSSVGFKLAVGVLVTPTTFAASLRLRPSGKVEGSASESERCAPRPFYLRG